jgi:dynamin 1-like protein
VTRVPLILQLVRPQDGDNETWGEFVHHARLHGRKFRDFGQIKQTIIEETDRIAGKQRGVSNNPIVLRISSPTSIPLTLVDTPGLTRIAVEGQPDDIESQIKQMVSSYIEKPNSIILAVSPATMDIATSDSLRLARTYDAQGERTIGVLTKLDIMDRGTDALDVLGGRIIPLRLGFVGVVCRSQQDIESGKSLQQSLVDEARFFASSPAYGSVAHVNGINYLAVKVRALLV